MPVSNTDPKPEPTSILRQRELTERLRAAEARYRQLFENHPQPMYVFDTETLRFLEVNDAAVRQYGYSREEFLAMGIDEIRPSEDVPALRERIASIGSGVQPAGVWRHRRQDGSTLLVDVTVHVQELDGRRAMIVLANDVTAERRAAEQLEQQTALLRMASSMSRLGAWWIDVSTGALHGSNEIYDILEIPRDTPLDLAQERMRFGEEGDRLIAEAYARCVETGAGYDLMLPIDTAQGRRLWTHFMAEAVRGPDGNVVRVQGTFQDITAQKLAADEVQQSEARFRLLANATNDAIYDWDLVGGKLWWGDGLEATFGYPSEEASETFEFWIQRVHPDDSERLAGKLDLDGAPGASPWEAEYRFRARNGEYRHVCDRAQVLRDARGKAVRMIGGITDLTERRRIEERFRIAQRAESIGTLAAGIAHDLNNVFAPILPAIELLGDERSEAERAHLLATIDSSARYGADLVKRLLHFARGGVGDLVPLDLAPIVDGLAELVRETYPSNLVFELELAPGLRRVAADATQLRQVLLNLCANARDAMPNGGRLSLRLADVEVDAALAAAHPDAAVGPHVRIELEDTGCGIPHEHHERLFDPFFTTKAPGKGTGLGLPMVVTIVKNHCGFLRFESEVGRGTKFELFFPATPDAAASQAPPVDDEGRREGAGEFVLVVDDEAAVRSIAQRILERFGYRVLTAEHGAEALELFEAHEGEVAVVVTDLAMPVLDGPALVESLRAKSPDVRIICSSGYASPDEHTKSLRARGERFVQKPYTIDALLAAIAEALADGP